MNTSLPRALTAIGDYFGGKCSGEDVYLRAKCFGMLRAYDAVWQTDNKKYEIIDVEKTIVAPLVDLQMGTKTSYYVGGKLDIILRRKADKDIGLMDHKNLYMNFDDSDIEHLEIAGQPNTYGYLSMAGDPKLRPTFALWDIVVKSQHRPGKEGSKLIKVGKPERTHKGTGKILPAEEEVREHKPAETPEEFEERIFEIYMEDASKYLARPIVSMSGQRVADHMKNFFEWTRRLDADIRRGDHPANTDSCFTHNTPCGFLGLCTGRNDSKGFEKAEQPHSELEAPEGINPFKIITNSRLGMFKLCPRKHDLHYNQCLRKAGKEEQLALRIGSAMHIGFEIFYKAAM